jgi:uncharacterized coiled-coil protein SlyX
MATIKGTVTDINGDPVTDVTVSFSTDSLFVAEANHTTVDDTGQYSFTSVSADTYELRFESPGFESVTRTVTVPKNGTEREDVTLPAQSQRVIGEDNAGGEVGVYGFGRGRRGIGVKGTAPGVTGFGLYTPDDAKIDGRLYADNIYNPGADIFILTGVSTVSSIGNVLMGDLSNQANSNADGASIGGGRDNTVDGISTVVGGGNSNTASGDYASVGGGKQNDATANFATVAGGGGETGATITEGNKATESWATVSGGGNNRATGVVSTVGGGFNNLSSGQGATVPGGEQNRAKARNSFAAGQNAFISSSAQNAFVWNDGGGYHSVNNESVFRAGDQVADEPVLGSNTFNVSARGGVRFVTGEGDVTYIEGGSAGWARTSTRAAKTNVDPVDPDAALDGVRSMEIATWEYRDADGEGAGTTHIGPMAEDFHEAFEVGASDNHINSINADGVALAAIQGLATRLDRVDELESELTDRDDRVDDLEQQIADQNDQIDDLSGELDERDERIETLEREKQRLAETVADLADRVAELEDK